MAQDTAVPKLSFQYWLDKAVEWGHTTTLESQQDVCLHLPKLQEFLQQIYESLKHMNSTTAIQRFPLIGQLLGRLCWNPFVVGYDESQKTLMWCLCCLYSNEPQNPVELKANSWILSLLCHLLSSSSWGANEVGTGTFISALGYTSADYYSKLVKNIVSSLVTELKGNQFNGLNIQGRVSDDHVTVVSLFCVPLITLPDVTPLLEALLTYHGGGSQEVLSSEFLEAVNETFLKKKIALSESAILSLWLRHLPSLEKATLHLFERLISTQTSSLEHVVSIIKDSFLPQAACHPAIFKIVDEIFKNALLETGGTPEVMTIIQMFTQCFVQAHQKDNKQGMKDRGHNRDPKQCRVKLKELRQAYQKTREANGRSGSEPQTCRFYDELHAILGGSATTTPAVLFDSFNGDGGNTEAGFGDEEDDDEVVDNSQQASRETGFPDSQELFLTLDLEPVPPEPTQGCFLDPAGGEGTSAACVSMITGSSPSQRLVKIRKKKKKHSR
ncbi:Fanconi anemia group C protein isoform X3 [Caretta caretta]|uniref:Fanconi anemia group C protein isoform X3 n=1 Tax=Caretta caretta TaxID=8467 RepID=UPI003F4B4431